MPWIEPGEFGRARAAHEDARADQELAVLEERLAAGWMPEIAAEAHRLQATLSAAIARSGGRDGALCNETAVGLVGEAHGASFADWWAEARGLDDRTAALVREAVIAAASMTMLEGYVLGVRCATEQSPPAPLPRARTPRELWPSRERATVR